MIRVLWGQQVKAIIDIKIGNADTDSYKYEPMTALLAWCETITKEKHGNHCNDQLKKNSPFVLSVYGFLGGGFPGRTHTIESNHGIEKG